MFIVDDLLAAPFRGLVWVFKQVETAAREEMDQEEERITQRLSELYSMLDSGEITEEEFEEQERVLLDRLDELELYH